MMAQTEAPAKTGKSDTEKTERPNTVTITDAGPSRKKIAIEIPVETVREQLGTSLDTLMVEAELPGFRKGRAPDREKVRHRRPQGGQESARRIRLFQGHRGAQAPRHRRTHQRDAREDRGRGGEAPCLRA
jgi:hypothetical protein